MVHNLRHYLILLITCGTVFFFNLGAARLFDEDEPKNAECGREMFERADWIVPTFNYQLRTDKPIMLYWLMLSSFSAWGVSEFSARFPSACMATITILCVYQIGLRLFDRTVALWSGIILATCLMFTVSSRISTPDATLIALITLSLLIFVRSQPKSEQGWSQALATEQNWPNRYLPNHWTGFVLMYLVMGLAVLTKGPVGFLLPCTVIGAFLMCRDGCPRMPQNLSWRRPVELLNELVGYAAAFFSPSRFLYSLLAMRPILLIAVLTVVALPWYVAVGIQTDGEWLAGFFGNHNLGRFSSAMEGHQGPFFYYAIAILLGCFPWSVFLPVTLYLAYAKRDQMKQDHQGLLFLLCWVSVYIVFFSIAQTKLPNYVLPCYPALALLMGWMLVRWQEGELSLPVWAYQWGGRTLAISGLLLLISFPIVSWLLLPGYSLAGFVGLIPFSAGLFLMMKSMNSNRQPVLYAMGACAFLFVTCTLGGIAPWISQAQESSQIGLAARNHSETGVPLATCYYFAPNLPFYAEGQVQQLATTEEMEQFWLQHPDGLVAVRDWKYEELKESLAGRYQVEQTVSRFLRSQSVLILSKKAQNSPQRENVAGHQDESTTIR